MDIKEAIILGRMTYQVMLAKITKFPRPVSVNLQVTKVCNLDCPYCFADLHSLTQVPDPSTRETLETIDELYKYGCRHIILMGGEPLIRKDIGAIIKYIKSKWMRCEMVTNGYFVQRHIESLKLLDSLCISIDGPKEPNDKARGEGCHDKVLEAIPFLKKHGIKMRIHAVLTRYNLDSGLPYIGNLAKEFGIPFNFSMIMLPPDKRPDYINFTDEEITRFLHEYRRYRDEGYPVFTSDACFDYMLNWPKKGAYTIYLDDKLTPEEVRSVMPCNYGQYNAFMDMDGNVYKCCLTWKNGLNWREHGMRKCIEHVGKNLINCLSCRSIGDIERAILLRFASMENLKMVFKYMARSLSKTRTNN